MLCWLCGCDLHRRIFKSFSSWSFHWNVGRVGGQGQPLEPGVFAEGGRSPLISAPVQLVLCFTSSSKFQELCRVTSKENSSLTLLCKCLGAMCLLGQSLSSPRQSRGDSNLQPSRERGAALRTRRLSRGAPLCSAAHRNLLSLQFLIIWVPT